MLKLSKAIIESLAPNPDAVRNGKGLIKDLFGLTVSEDETVIYAQCRGSGANPYSCSVDFINQERLLPRCNCPSRQFPCKHSIGLMFAYVDGAKFVKGEIPIDILEKREKAQKSAQKAEQKKNAPEQMPDTATKPVSKSKINETLKKYDVQLEGLAVAEKLYKNILLSGLSSLDSKTLAAFQQQAKNLGNYYINGIKSAFDKLLEEISDCKKNSRPENEMITAMIYFAELVKKAQVHIEAKKAEQDISFDAISQIEELIGHIWTLEQLRAVGKCAKDMEAVQLAFNSYYDSVRKEYIDEGYFVDFSGEIFIKKNYRPEKALKYVKEDDTLNGVLEIKELFKYPGGINPRGRWESCAIRDVSEKDCEKILSFARSDFASALKDVKNQIKSVLEDKNPVMLLKIGRIDYLKNQLGAEAIEICDMAGVRITLDLASKLSENAAEAVCTAEYPVHIEHIKSVMQSLQGRALLVMYICDTATGTLKAKPLAIIGKHITRLVY